nr:G protein-coupled receptor [Proales similis]
MDLNSVLGLNLTEERVNGSRGVSTFHFDKFEYTFWNKVVFSCFMFPIMFLSISGNILVVIAISKYSHLKITNNIFLASLAVADCAVGILAMPPNALQLLTGKWYLKSFMCRFWFACDVLFSTASILHLCCISIDRYLSISDSYAFNYRAEHPTKSKRVRFMIASAWLTSALLSFVPMFTNLFTTPEHAREIDELETSVDGQCIFIVNLPYRLISSFISFWIPGLTMITFYSLVMKKANKVEKYQFHQYQSIRSHSIQTSRPEGSRVHRSSSYKPSRDSVARIWKREYKALKTLGTVMAVFCLCWIFFFLNYTLCDPQLNICPSWIGESILIQDILFWIGYFNSMVNPFLYNFTNPDFRRAFKHMLSMERKKSIASSTATNSDDDNWPNEPNALLGCCKRQSNETDSIDETVKLDELS